MALPRCLLCGAARVAGLVATSHGPGLPADRPPHVSSHERVHGDVRVVVISASAKVAQVPKRPAASSSAIIATGRRTEVSATRPTAASWSGGWTSQRRGVAAEAFAGADKLVALRSSGARLSKVRQHANAINAAMPGQLVAYTRNLRRTACWP